MTDLREPDKGVQIHDPFPAWLSIGLTTVAQTLTFLCRRFLIV